MNDYFFDITTGGEDKRRCYYLSRVHITMIRDSDGYHDNINHEATVWKNNYNSP